MKRSIQILKISILSGTFILAKNAYSNSIIEQDRCLLKVKPVSGLVNDIIYLVTPQGKIQPVWLKNKQKEYWEFELKKDCDVDWRNAIIRIPSEDKD